MTLTDQTDTDLRSLLDEVLGLGPARAAALTADSGLFGDLPELDSMAVAGLLTEIEDRFDVMIDDDDIDGDMLHTYGNLLAAIRSKRGEG